MRMRRKPWARPELEACPFYTETPSNYRGRWNEWFGNHHALRLELGCGKGGFIAQQAVSDPDHNYIAVDIKDAVLGLAKRNIENAYAAADRPADNIRLVTQDIERLFLMLEEGKDVVDRIYINFCNPWPRVLQQKKRLTHPRQLRTYRRFLAPWSEIWFKTDDAPLFEDTLTYLAACGFSIRYLTRNLHASSFTESFPTEHEQMFQNRGIPTKFLIAVLLPDACTPDSNSCL